jgi:hypothetical protein
MSEKTAEESVRNFIIAHALFYTFSFCSSELTSLLIAFTELQQCFGSDATTGGLKFQFATRIKADVDLIKDARAKGIDCKDIKLSCADKTSKGSKGTTFYFEIF